MGVAPGLWIKAEIVRGESVGVCLLPEPANNSSSCQRLCVKGIVGCCLGKVSGFLPFTRISERPSDRRASHAAREYMSRERPQQVIPVMRRLMWPRPSDGPRTTCSKSGGSRGGPSLCPRRDQSRPPSFPVRQSDAEHQHALRRVPCEYRLRECAEQPRRKSLRTGQPQTTSGPFRQTCQ